MSRVFEWTFAKHLDTTPSAILSFERREAKPSVERRGIFQTGNGGSKIKASDRVNSSERSTLTLYLSLSCESSQDIPDMMHKNCY